MTQIFKKTDILKFSLLLAICLFMFQYTEAKEPNKPTIDEVDNHSQPLKPVRGFVVDECGEPMVGVVVCALGSSKSTITNTEGKYSLLANMQDVLKFSQIGAIAKEEKITTSRIVNIELAIE